ncbi:hypothetical protein [Yinghuangia soli]|uniref:Uncharacterized protein n=1 Tax=Yinghuangia soli TaxID=2908204 RepID=A0AA41U4K6_9ACTN|nr:hypothetical protein [Yinghuangia soli]MCF2533025.1 hypothetical protein [Yinghuangia soli]
MTDTDTGAHQGPVVAEDALADALTAQADRARPLRTVDTAAVLAGADRRRRRRGVAAALAGATAVAVLATGAVVLAERGGDPATPALGPSGTGLPAPTSAAANVPPDPNRVAVVGKKLPADYPPPPTDKGPEPEPDLPAEALTWQELSAMETMERFAYQDALGVNAKAAAAVGPARFADIYKTVRLGPDYRYVTVYLTDLGRRGEFLDALRENPAVDPARVTFARAYHSDTACKAVWDVLAGLIESKRISGNSITSTTDCAYVILGTEDVVSTRRFFEDPANGYSDLPIPVAVVYGQVIAAAARAAG